MNPEQIRALVRQEIQANSSASRFSLNTIPRHIHNGVDSPFTFQPILTYAGSLLRDGGPFILPKGWSCSKIGSGSYTVTHNFGSDVIYAVSAIPGLDAQTIQYYRPPTTPGTINFYTLAIGGGGASAVDSSFDFLITVVNNRSQSIPTYITL